MSLLAGLLLIASSSCVDCPPASVDETLTVVDGNANDWPLGGAFGGRLFCIEGLESTHGLHMLNPSSGARGWLQWLPSTARAWGVAIGDRRSEWFAAARIHAVSERFFLSQWPVTA